MPMVVYTEEELIDAQNRAAADAVTDVAAQRDKAMRENTMIRNRVNNLREAMQECVDLLLERTQGSAARSPGHNARLRLEQALAANSG